MRRLKRASILLSLIEALRDNDSWCGETNIQKAAYFLQELLKVPLQFDFMLYKYGPYSFELCEELTSLCADSILDLEIRDSRYGPSYVSGELRDFIVKRFPKTISQYRDKIDFVAKRLGDKRVPELEKLATSLYVYLENPRTQNTKKRADKIRKLKPHISKADALIAVKEVDELVRDIEELNV